MSLFTNMHTTRIYAVLCKYDVSTTGICGIITHNIIFFQRTHAYFIDILDRIIIHLIERGSLQCESALNRFFFYANNSFCCVLSARCAACKPPKIREKHRYAFAVAAGEFSETILYYRGYVSIISLFFNRTRMSSLFMQKYISLPSPDNG